MTVRVSVSGGYMTVRVSTHDCACVSGGYMTVHV